MGWYDYKGVSMRDIVYGWENGDPRLPFPFSKMNDEYLNGGTPYYAVVRDPTTMPFDNETVGTFRLSGTSIDSGYAHMGRFITSLQPEVSVDLGRSVLPPPNNHNGSSATKYIYYKGGKYFFSRGRLSISDSDSFVESDAYDCPPVFLMAIQGAGGHGGRAAFDVPAITSKWWFSVAGGGGGGSGAFSLLHVMAPYGEGVITKIGKLDAVDGSVSFYPGSAATSIVTCGAGGYGGNASAYCSRIHASTAKGGDGGDYGKLSYSGIPNEYYTLGSYTSNPKFRFGCYRKSMNTVYTGTSGSYGMYGGYAMCRGGGWGDRTAKVAPAGNRSVSEYTVNPNIYGVAFACKEPTYCGGSFSSPENCYFYSGSGAGAFLGGGEYHYYGDRNTHREASGYGYGQRGNTTYPSLRNDSGNSVFVTSGKTGNAAACFYWCEEEWDGD